MNPSRTGTARLKRQSNWQRDLTNYGFQLELLPRYNDINPGRHVSNVALLDYLAEAQMQYQIKAMGLAPWFPGQYLLRPASLISNFLALTGYPAGIRCGMEVVGKNSSCYRIQGGLFQRDACVCTQDRWMAAWHGGERIKLPADVYDRLPMADAIGASELKLLAVAPDSYPFQVDITTRHGDLDADQCIGESAIAGFAEQTRSQLLFVLTRAAGINFANDAFGLLNARTAIGFRRYVPVHGSLRLAAGASRLGGSSFTLNVGIFRKDICLALADTVMVCINKEFGRPMPIPAGLRRELELLACDVPEAVCTGGTES